TPDILLPKQARYQTALYPETSQLLSGDPKKLRGSKEKYLNHKHGSRQLPQAFCDLHIGSVSAGSLLCLNDHNNLSDKKHLTHPIYRTHLIQVEGGKSVAFINRRLCQQSQSTVKLTVIFNIRQLSCITASNRLQYI
uniref:hypothetical protein n=1 Tax=Endozoicomonas sp. ONNA2 TaxID=2828741 RepID=UPI002148F29B